MEREGDEGEWRGREEREGGREGGSSRGIPVVSSSSYFFFTPSSWYFHFLRNLRAPDFHRGLTLFMVLISHFSRFFFKTVFLDRSIFLLRVYFLTQGIVTDF